MDKLKIIQIIKGFMTVLQELKKDYPNILDDNEELDRMIADYAWLLIKKIKDDNPEGKK